MSAEKPHSEFEFILRRAIDAGVKSGLVAPDEASFALTALEGFALTVSRCSELGQPPQPPPERCTQLLGHAGPCVSRQGMRWTPQPTGAESSDGKQ